MLKKSSCFLSVKWLFVLLFFFGVLYSYSQDLEPRVYANVAKDLNVVAIGYVFMNGNVLTDPSLPITDFTLHSHNLAVNYIRTFAVSDKLARVQVVLPYTFMDGSQTRTNGDVLTGSRTGFADMKVRLGINLLGSPALDKTEFRNFEQKTILGVSLVTSIPTGRYYDDKQVNIGTNRWDLNPKLEFQNVLHMYMLKPMAVFGFILIIMIFLEKN